MPTQLPPSALVLCLAAACGTRPASEQRETPVAARSLPASTAAAPTDARPEPPSRWVGAGIERRRLAVSVASTGSKPQPLAAEQPGSRDASLEVTDVAYDTRRELVHVATCCEPASGHLWVLDTRAPGSGFRQGDQGFAVDVAGPTSMIARTDTFGTLAVRPSAAGRQELRADAGAADVAVDPLNERVVALVDTQRLRALVPTVTSRPPALMVMQPRPEGGWADRAYPLPPDMKGCRIVPLKDGAIGILAGAPDRANPVRCTGERLDAYDPALARLRTGVLTFPAGVRHLSIDDSKTFLIFTTIGGAVGWRTLDGREGSLASEGFAAADW